MFADDTAILASHTEPKLVARAINRHLVLEDWFSKWKIALNVAKTEAVFFTRKTRLIYPDIYLHNERIPWSQSTKYLGVTLDKKLTFKQHITRIRESFIKKAHTLSHLISRRSKLSRSNKLLIYSSLLRPVITYASPVWSFAAKTHIQKLEVLQNKTLRQILRADWNEKVINHGSIPITIDCNVVAFIVFEEGFHQPIKRTKQSVFLDVTVFRHTLVD
ncbi:RNA-directed DNA polymerase from mobile element jockey [Trichonephila clavipes]|nr:RNA-directed DNA polymerase from mobile element jockey [Trichonephila clavipes]